jgi:hypothetical protein
MKVIKPRKPMRLEELKVEYYDVHAKRNHEITFTSPIPDGGFIELDFDKYDNPDRLRSLEGIANELGLAPQITGNKIRIETNQKNMGKLFEYTSALKSLISKTADTSLAEFLADNLSIEQIHA